MGLLSNLILTSKKSSIIQELEQAIAARNQSVNDVASDLMRSWEKGGTIQSERASTEATPPLISVVVPLFNEEDNVAHLVERLANTLNNLGKSYEVLLIDDGSGDATWTRIAKAAARHHPRFRGLRLARRFGHQAALLAGLSRARGQAVVSMDGDLQHPPELIPELVKAWKQGAAVVETRRHYNAQTSGFKKLSSALFYRFFSFMSEINKEEGRSDFRLVLFSSLIVMPAIRPHLVRLARRHQFLALDSDTATFGESVRRLLRIVTAGDRQKNVWWRPKQMCRVCDS